MDFLFQSRLSNFRTTRLAFGFGLVKAPCEPNQEKPRSQAKKDKIILIGF